MRNAEYRSLLRDELRHSANAIAYWLEQPRSDPSRDENLRYLFGDVEDTKRELARTKEDDVKKAKKKAKAKRPRARRVSSKEIAAHPTRSLRASDYAGGTEPGRSLADGLTQYTLYHEDVVVADTVYRVFLRIPRDELGVVVQSAVAQHLKQRKPPVVAVRAEVKELRGKHDQYKEES